MYCNNETRRYYCIEQQQTPELIAKQERIAAKLLVR